MKQATLKIAGTAALGVALAAAAAGSASAAGSGGFGSPANVLDKSGVLTGAATSATGKLPTAPVTNAVGDLNHGVGSSLAPAPAAQDPAADGTADAPAEDASAGAKKATRGLPGADALSKVPGAGVLTGALGNAQLPGLAG
ncbi:hypothetical protein GCM10010430_42960 [Kitasatospora cystarginea]|uniref:ATP-binding protein n=1 Tax=Kitasatospora cystarginea TaxID=58350 RepID=A0ABN3EDV7_9ACTN